MEQQVLKILQISTFQNNKRFMPKTIKELIPMEISKIIEFLKLVSLIVPLEI
jgi:hypothetical protein